MAKKYTAQQMREAADFFVRNAEMVRRLVKSNSVLANIHETIPMLRQAADAMEREKKTLRNCDKFQDYDTAKEEWFHECCYWFGGCDGCGGTFTKRDGEPDFERWLFMPVNEEYHKKERENND